MCVILQRWVVVESAGREQTACSNVLPWHGQFPWSPFQSPSPTPQISFWSSLFRGVCVHSVLFPPLKLQKSSAVIPAGSLGALTNSCLCVTKLPCSESDLITIMRQYLVNLFLLEAFPNPQEHYFHAFISLGWDLTLQLLWVNACRSRSCWRGWEHSPLIPFQ